jgi:hypothetical protein
MTAKPFRPAVRGIMRAAIISGGPCPKVCRFVEFDTRKGRYAVYRAQGGRLGRRLVLAHGTQADALLHGCADNQFLNCPGVWKRAKGVTK